VVYGMPKEAFKRGAVGKEVPLDDIAEEIVRFGR
jgi:chemotaxis response regulator CheB